MLIFGRGLKIAFYNVGKTSIIQGKIRYKMPTQRDTNGYVVTSAFKPDDCIVHEDQIVQVLLKDKNGNDCWIGIDNLYKYFPNGVTIRPDERYNIGIGIETPIHYTQLSSNSLNYMIHDERAVRSAIGGEFKLTPRKVIFNGPATVVMWQDGTKTVVKKTEDDTDDREKAVMFAIIKKACGSRAKMNRYLKLFKEDKSNEEKKEEAGSSELCQCEQGAGQSSGEGPV